jgi:hypothetical protein
MLISTICQTERRIEDETHRLYKSDAPRPPADKGMDDPSRAGAAGKFILWAGSASDKA